MKKMSPLSFDLRDIVDGNALAFKTVLNLYPPYLGAGIRIRRISPDFREIEVGLPLRWYNRNYVGTHFGGSLYAMTDPFFMLMLMQNLGREYIVWDKSSHIDFMRPGRGSVRALFSLDEIQLEKIKARTATGEKYLPVFKVDVKDRAGTTVARITKELYVRRKAASDILADRDGATVS